MGLFDLEGLGKFRTRLDRSRAGGLSVFVGRARDMEILEAALERARSGGQVVGIMAEAGAGKSRYARSSSVAVGIAAFRYSRVAAWRTASRSSCCRYWSYGALSTTSPRAIVPKPRGENLWAARRVGGNLP